MKRNIVTAKAFIERDDDKTYWLFYNFNSPLNNLYERLPLDLR